MRMCRVSTAIDKTDVWPVWSQLALPLLLLLLRHYSTAPSVARALTNWQTASISRRKKLSSTKTARNRFSSHNVPRSTTSWLWIISDVNWVNWAAECNTTNKNERKSYTLYSRHKETWLSTVYFKQYFRPHRMLRTAALVSRLSVCSCNYQPVTPVKHAKISWTHPNVVWLRQTRVAPRNCVFDYVYCLCIHTGKPGECDRTMCAQRRCGLMSDYFDHLFWFSVFIVRVWSHQICVATFNYVKKSQPSDNWFSADMRWVVTRTAAAAVIRIRIIILLVFNPGIYTTWGINNNSNNHATTLQLRAFARHSASWPVGPI